jgi:hypothetical protein
MDLLDAQRWSYVPEVPEDLTQIRELLVTYSHIPPSSCNQHLLRIRDDGWKVARLPSIGRWKFLGLIDRADPSYKQVLFRLTLSHSKDVLLDLGCCVGQVIRQFRSDGVKGSRLIGTDIEPKFIDIGYELFQDSAKLQATFVVGDMLDPADRRLSSLCGKVTMIHAASFFHLFTWTQQLYAAKRLVSFLKRGTRNAVIFGKQVGTLDPSRQVATVPRPYLHDQASFQKLWDEVGKLTATKWSVHMEPYGHVNAAPGVDKDSMLTQFIIYQL